MCEKNFFFTFKHSSLHTNQGSLVFIPYFIATEDLAAATLGISVFLLTNDLINKKEADISAVPRGDYEDLLAYLKTI